MLEELKISSLEEQKKQEVKHWDDRIGQLQTEKQQAVGPLLELEQNCKLLLEINTQRCKDEAQKASTRIKDRFLALTQRNNDQ